MRKAVSADYNVFALAAGKTVHWRVSIKKTAVLNELHSTGTWIDVTAYMDKNIPENITEQVELAANQFTSNSLKFKGLDILWWKENIFNATDYLELMIEFWLNDLTADTITLFAGWIDKKGDQFCVKDSEKENSVEFMAYGYGEYADRMSAAGATTQIIVKDVGGTGVDGICLVTIPGIYPIDANIASYVLKKGKHTLTYEWNTGTEQMNLDGGSWITLPTSSGQVTLVNEDGTQKLTVWVNVNYLSTVNPAITQEVVVPVAGATLPFTWHCNVWIFGIIKNLFALIGVTEYDFDNFEVPTYDGRWIRTYYDVPMLETYTGKPRCIKWDDTNQRLWIGVDDHILYRNLSTHVYIDLGVVSSGYNVLRLWTERVASNELWGVSRDGSHHWKVFCVTITTGAMVSYSLPGRYPYSYNDSAQNFAFAKNFSTSGVIYYLSHLDNDNVYYFDIATRQEVLAATLIHIWGLAEYAGWSDGTDYYILTTGSPSSKADLLRVYKSGGTWYFQTKLSGIDYYQDAVYNEHEGKAILGVNLLQSYTLIDNTIMTISPTAYCVSFGYAANAVHCISDGKPAQIIGDSLEVVNCEAFPTRSGWVPTFNGLTYNETLERFYGIEDDRQLLYMVATRGTMYVEKEIAASESTAGDVIREIAKAFCLMPHVIANKKARVYRRGDETGAIVTTGEIVLLDADRAVNISKETGYGESYQIIIVRNEESEQSYDGTSFDVKAFGDEKTLVIESKYFTTALLRDYAKYFWTTLSKPKQRYLMPTPLIPFFQYEPYDGADLNFFGKINTLVESVPKSGIVVGQSISRDGTTEFEVITTESEVVV